MKNVVFLYSQELEKYEYPPEHPFNTVRAKRVLDVIQSMGLLSGPSRSIAVPEPAERVVIKKFHSARYLHALKAASRGKWDVEALSMGIGSQDCPIFKGLYEYACLATGATLLGGATVHQGTLTIQHDAALLGGARSLGGTILAESGSSIHGGVTAEDGTITSEAGSSGARPI